MLANTKVSEHTVHYSWLQSHRLVRMPMLTSVNHRNGGRPVVCALLGKKFPKEVDRFRQTFCRETLVPVIHVDVTLTRIIYQNIAANYCYNSTS